MKTCWKCGKALPDSHLGTECEGCEDGAVQPPENGIPLNMPDFYKLDMKKVTRSNADFTKVLQIFLSETYIVSGTSAFDKFKEYLQDEPCLPPNIQPPEDED